MKEFWVTNITNLNVSLGDLGLSIPPKKTWNLLDKRHFHCTLEQLQKSLKNGSLYKKSNKIKFIEKPIFVKEPNKIIVSQIPRSIPIRSAVEIEEKIYPELNLEEEISDQKFADELTREDAEETVKNVISKINIPVSNKKGPKGFKKKNNLTNALQKLKENRDTKIEPEETHEFIEENQE